MELDNIQDNYISSIQHEFVNETNVEPQECTWFDYCKRVTLTALPFIALNKTLSFPVSLVQHAIRAYKNITDLFENSGEIAPALLETAISIISITGTIFFHPLGTVISKGYQTSVELYLFVKHVQEEKVEKAIENVVNILNNILYFILLAYRVCELIVASLVTQILLKAYQAKKEFVKDHYIESAGKLLMAAVRSHMFMDRVTEKCADIS